MLVLIIEDEKEVRDMLEFEFKTQGWQVLALESGENALVRMSQTPPDVALIDQILPGKMGTDIIREIRSSTQFGTLPIIMVTALGSEGDKLKAFDLGADDYITKPFMIREVVARVKALIRRTEQSHKSEQKQLVYQNLMVDFSAHKVIKDGGEVPLTLTEFKILGELLKESGQVLSRDNLRERALGNLNVTDRTIDVHMASLRKKLGTLGDAIETVRGVGYRFTSNH